MPTSNLEQYIDYFRQLAVRHKDIRHDPASETGDSLPDAKRFAVFGGDEIARGARSKMGFPALCLELYENHLSSETVHDIRQRPKGALMIIDNGDDNDEIAKIAAYAQAEVILYDILKQIWQDHYGPEEDRCETPFKQFRFTMELTATGKLFDNQFGYYIQFDFDFQNTIDITKPPAEGTFIND